MVQQHGLAGALALSVLSACTFDSDERAQAPVEGRHAEAIVGGAEVLECAWPSAVYLDHETVSHCTGTLVHPELVVFAAHCMRDARPPPVSAGFGENASALRFSVAMTECKSDPRAHSVPSPGHGHDIAYCKLAEPVTGVPIVPLLMGCELGALGPGASATAVGFGRVGPGAQGDGIKREVSLPITALVENEAQLGGDGKGTCYGDSGGPLFARAPNGEWRLFGITSWAPGDCGDGEYVSLIHAGITWLEQSSGIDLTPCHADDGTWAPTPDCGGFPLEPDRGQGSWSDSCRSSGISALSAACGPPSDGTEQSSDDGRSEGASGCTFASARAPSSPLALIAWFGLFVWTVSRRNWKRQARNHGESEVSAGNHHVARTSQSPFPQEPCNNEDG